MTATAFPLPQPEIEEFCRRNRIRKLSLFGSILTPRFRPESDIDILVEFEPGARTTLFDIAGMELELTEKLGRKADVRTPGDLSRYFRDQVLATAAVQYPFPRRCVEGALVGIAQGAGTSASRAIIGACEMSVSA
jgi:predicted nucleotidyltransferase